MTSGQEKASDTRSRWPHALNVVTNFSKPPQLAQQAANTGRRLEHDAVDAFRRGHRRLNSSADIQTPNGHKRSDSQTGMSQQSVDGMTPDAALGLGSQKFENARKAPSPPRDNKGPIYNLKRASSKMTTLSPNDRPILIGFSVPSDKLEQHTMSPDVGPTPIVTSNQQFGRDRRPSETPSIVITSAKSEAPWSAEPDNPFESARRRVPSSVYSRATNARGTPKQIVIPSMPTAPRRSLPLTNHAEPSRPPNTFSTYTMFDEDESPKGSTHDHRYSSESQLRILKRSSTDSIATRHRSQGWWNHIVSPFLPKAGTVPWRSASRETEAVPDLPGLAIASSVVDKDQSSDGCATPIAPPPRRSSSGHTSIWTDLSPIEIEKRSQDITMLRSPFHESPSVFENRDRDLSDWFEGLGEAAEYYHACWHDQNYSTPYFECQDHVCIPRRFGKFPLPQGSSENYEKLLDGAKEARKIVGDRESNDTIIGGFQHAPANRFDAAFQKAISPEAKVNERPLSESTVIEDVDATPLVQEARAAPVVRAPPAVLTAQPPPRGGPKIEPAKDVQEIPIPLCDESKDSPPVAASLPLARAALEKAPRNYEPPSAKDAPPKKLPVTLPSNPKPEKPAKRFVAVMPPDHPSLAHTQPISLEAPSPAPQPKDGVSLDESPQKKPLALATVSNPSPITIINHYHHNSHERIRSDQITLNDMYPPQRPKWSPKENNEFGEKQKRHSRDSAEKGRGCHPKLTACLIRGKPKTKKQKWLLIGITSALVAMIILTLLLAMLLTRKADHMEVQSQWLNLTGFPPIPTGVSTVIQPDPVQASSGCIHPATLWSCAVPKEQQASIAPNAPDQPNFRIEIRFQNSSIVNGTSSNDTSLDRRSTLHAGNAATAGSFVRSRLLHIRDFTSNLFTPSPSPPTREDQIFLGNTTDRNQQPFDGAATPFFISFINFKKLSPSAMIKRASTSSETDIISNGTETFPNLGAAIPPPSTNLDGTGSPALLYPLASAQPLRLYDRDMATEHYGFYTYFDRSIFLKSTALLNFSNETPSEIPEDENGGTEENAAKVRCTWAQTRFLVQIWTRRGIATSLLQSSNSSTDSSPGSTPKNLTASSANNFTRPGSFPYPVSITLDRHGGDIKKKMIYCYGLDEQKHIISDAKQIQLEDRAFGGALVNPAQGPFGEVKVSGDDGGPGGIDGGDGGCGCRWENFSNGRAQ
ncbi:MAG: hypothetical protein L6R40_006031 [Gallowayella cf. fulva]|nr:MAG: hypothetical protein L6R40_006031 [Xanthomendoza cf. fulva]